MQVAGNLGAVRFTHRSSACHAPLLIYPEVHQIYPASGASRCGNFPICHAEDEGQLAMKLSQGYG